ncbi:hypothetical protein GIB67_006528 [Kingdonia uniflora]|uniref:Uncharacterized protein n=1 Tax=Kingdonia uniflora TaxID=39325 RepID=A0A7J7LEM9_9MAGN|nr:hypothetical protein GIB67_006528 [Kingdonia uniflora]
MKPSETDMQQDLVQEAMRYQIETPTVVAPAIGSSSSVTKIRAVVVRVCSQLEEHGKMLLKLDDHGKMLHTHGKMLERISMSTVGDSTLPLGDTPLIGQYQFFTLEKTVKRKREGGNEKEDGKRKKAEPRTKKGKGEWQKKSEEVDVLNKKKKVEVLKKEAFTDEQFDLVPLIQLKGLIPKIPKKGLANKQVAPEVILEVVNALMVDDDVEVGRKVNFNVISSEYGGDLLEMEEIKNGDEKVDDVAEEEDSEQPTVVVYYTRKKDVQHDNEIMMVAEVVKIDIVFFNQEKVIGEVYQASADQTTTISVEEQTLEVEKTEDEASQASADQTTVVSAEEQTIETKESKKEVEQNKEEVFEGKDDDYENLQNKPYPEQVIKQMAVDQTNV